MEGEEGCDDGNVENGDGCDEFCATEPVCGDGVMEGEEGCDDGNVENDDGCDEFCELEPACGDGNVDDGEECDDGNLDNGDGCDAGCTAERFDLIHGVEVRDGGFAAGAADVFTFVADDVSSGRAETSDGAGGCPGDTTLALFPVDGAGARGPQVAGDDDGGIAPCSLLTGDLPAGTYELEVRGFGDAAIAAYVLDFRLEVAVDAGGDFDGAFVAGGDDLYTITVPEDGAYSFATGDGQGDCPGDTEMTLFGFDGEGARVEIEVDDDDGPGLCSFIERELAAGDYEVVVRGFGAAALDAYVFTAEVPVAVCGDGAVEGDEACDDGNLEGGDGCDGECRIEACGNGRVDAGEVCDDGNEENGDGCDALCTPELVQLIRGIEQRRNGIPATQEDLYRFVADDLSALRIETSDGAGGCPGDTTMTLFAVDAEGNRGAQAADPDDGGPVLCSLIELGELAAGTYEIRVGEFGDNGEIGQYTLDFRLEVPLENGDFAGAFVAEGDDLFSFSLAGEGAVSFTTGDGDGGCPDGDTTMTLFGFDEGGARVQVAFDDDGGVGFCSSIAEAALGAGDYEVVVQGFGGGPHAGYVLTAELPTCGNGELNEGEQCDDGNLDDGDGCDAACQFEQECGNDDVEGTEQCDDGNLDNGDGCDALCTLETDDLIRGVEVRRNSTVLGQQDDYRFTVDHTQSHLRAETSDGEGGCAGVGDTTIGLFPVDAQGAVGARLEFDDDGGVNLCSLLDLDLEAGDYLLRVRGFGDGPLTDYRLDYRLETRVGEDGDFTGAFVVSGDDLFTFAAAAGAGVTLETSVGAGCGAQDTTMTLFRLVDGDRVQVAFNDDGGPALCSRIEQANLAAGMYVVLVQGFGGGRHDGYTLSVIHTPPLAFGGVRNGLPQAEAEASGFEVCYSDLYDADLDHAAMQAACDGGTVMVACREVDEPDFLVAAMGARDEVFRVTPAQQQQSTHAHNGVQWYYNDAWSFGFAPAGVPVQLNQADVEDDPGAAQRLSWHTIGAAGGYRCGATTDLNNDAAWERIVLHRPGALFAPTCGDGEVEEGEACDDGNLSNDDACSSVCEVLTVCGDGEVEEGEECDDGNADAGDGCDDQCQSEGLAFGGVQADLPQAEAEAGGFEICYSDLYDADLDHAGMQAACDGDTVLVACREVGQANFLISAMGARGEVFRVTPAEQLESTHTHNGVQWYYNDAWAFGFAPLGAAVRLFNADIEGGAEDALRLSWHTIGNAGGYRCGATRDLNANNGWERIVMHRPGGIAVGVQVCGNGTVEEGEDCDDGNLDNDDGCNSVCEVVPFCGDGNIDPGEVCDDGNGDDGDGCDGECQSEGLAFGGVQNGVAMADALAGGFQVCFSDLYNADLDHAGMQAACDGDTVMVACREVGQPDFLVSAMGARGEVFRATPAEQEGSTHTHNGVQWYYNDNWSFGFAPAGVPVRLNQADVEGDPGAAQRLSWHTIGNSGGYRCGATAGLNANAGWERIVLHRGGGIAVDVQICGNGEVEEGEACDDGNLANDDDCNSVCEIIPPCGNGRPDDGEQCDDGNLVNGDGCDALCTFENIDLLQGVEQRTNAFPAGNEDTYRFVVDDESVLTVETSDGEGGCDGVGDTFMELFMVDGNGDRGALVVADDDGGAGLCSRILRPDLAPGTYEISVEELGNNAQIDGYTLDFRLEVPVDAGGRFDGAVAQDGNDLYSFTLGAPAQVTGLTGDGQGGCPAGDTYLTLFGFDAEGARQVITQDDDGGVGVCSRFEELLQPGDYEIEVRGFANGAHGGYILTMLGVGGLSFAGVQVNVPLEGVLEGGFEVCYSDLYGADLDTGAINADCDGGVLMVACREVDAPNLSVAAMGMHDEVLTVVPNEADAAHDHNGVRWYYSEDFSFGFAAEGQVLARGECDTMDDGGETRLCWHTIGPFGGYRCGATEGLNNNNGWERLVLHRPGNL